MCCSLEIYGNICSSTPDVEWRLQVRRAITAQKADYGQSRKYAKYKYVILPAKIPWQRC